jgi:phospholipid/cholesterol/gamma-HCH transport system substrate-binding protein
MFSGQVKVGFFVFLGFAVLAALVFLIGDERHMFEGQAYLRATFRDVSGLKVGSPVRMGGVDVGHVTAITFGATPADRGIHVRFSLVERQLNRVRSDSVVRIASKGLLGDKALDLTMGNSSQLLADNSEVRTEESDDIANAMRGATEAVTRANEVLTNVAAATRPFADPRFGNDVAGMVRDLRTITHAVAEGPGTAHALLSDPAMAARIDRTLGLAESTMGRVNAMTADVSSLTREARTGHGLVHALVYDREGEAMVRSFARTADEVAAITHDVRTGNGGLHQIIYGQESAQIVTNAAQASASLRDVMADIRAGRGTVGALLTDPSLYEDMKALVGNVQRNEILRAMVRYSIHADDARGPAVRATPAPAATTTAPVSR